MLKRKAGLGLLVVVLVLLALLGSAQVVSAAAPPAQPVMQGLAAGADFHQL